ncbi:hypothetical protein ACFYZ8_06290 [Streptomyces sp. NPDC001668]
MARATGVAPQAACDTAVGDRRSHGREIALVAYGGDPDVVGGYGP